LTERLGTGRRNLLHIMAERNQFAGHIVRCHTSLDANQAPRYNRKPGPNPATGKILTQNNRSLLIQAIKCSVFLPVSMPMVRATTVSVLC
jgi:hypothetical protein